MRPRRDSCPAQVSERVPVGQDAHGENQCEALGFDELLSRSPGARQSVPVLPVCSSVRSSQQPGALPARASGFGDQRSRSAQTPAITPLISRDVVIGRWKLMPGMKSTAMSPGS